MRSRLVCIFLLALARAALPEQQSVAGERPAPGPLEFEKCILDGAGIGMLFPTFADFDGDEKIDLVVGVRGLGRGRLRDSWGEGGLLVYRNRGTNAAPVHAKPFWLDDLVPSGRIPSG